jgi:hypothetical protein
MPTVVSSTKSFIERTIRRENRAGAVPGRLVSLIAVLGYLCYEPMFRQNEKTPAGRLF